MPNKIFDSIAFNISYNNCNFNNSSPMDLAIILAIISMMFFLGLAILFVLLNRR